MLFSIGILIGNWRNASKSKNFSTGPLSSARYDGRFTTVNPSSARNIQRDKEVTEQLTKDGWIVLRFWGKEILTDVKRCADIIQSVWENGHE